MRVVLRGIVLIIIVGGVFFLFRQPEKVIAPQERSHMETAPLIFASSAFPDGGFIPLKYTCDGALNEGEINPSFDIEGVVPEAKSLALIMDDPDAPLSTWVHWVKWNIPPDTLRIEEGKEPPGVSGNGTGGNILYHGPCPPSGTHRYFFKLYVLDQPLTLKEGSGKKELEAAMDGHILQSATYMGRYKRTQKRG